ncbi:MAG: GNAT family N-acetyltransferase [Polyangiaceae bacterium]|nr:GNAT family N-acetyltransferase [Polyangiaceae bacterium]
MRPARARVTFALAMLVTAMEPEDREAVQAIAHLCGTEVDVAAELGRGWALPWVIRDAEGGAPIAFLVGWRAADELHVIDIGTHPDHRRRGAARKLLLELIAYGKAHGFRLVVLEVSASNGPARSLYGSLGFGVARIRENYYSDAGEDGLEMLLVLDPETIGAPGSPQEASS